MAQQPQANLLSQPLAIPQPAAPPVQMPVQHTAKSSSSATCEIL